MKTKIWTSKKADAEFSKYIRERDKKCLRCGKKEHLQCSHFFSRANSATRYDPENCIALCYACHYGNARGWEYLKMSDYREFMLRRLGEEGYKKLEARSRSIKNRKEAIIEIMKIIKC